jgi:hypothetical protein
MWEAGQGEVTLTGDELGYRDASNVAGDVLVVGCHHWQRLRLHLDMIAQRVFGHLKWKSLTSIYD